jgi:hypothetical protein
MEVGNKKVAFGLVLQLGEILQSSKVITQVQVARGTNAAQNNFHK